MVIDSTIVEEGDIYVDLTINNSYMDTFSYVADNCFSILTTLIPSNIDFLQYITKVSPSISNSNTTITNETSSTSFVNLLENLPISESSSTPLRLTYTISGDISSFYDNVPTLSFKVEAVK